MPSYEVIVSGKTYQVEIEPRQSSPADSAERKSDSDNSGESSWNVRLDGREISVNTLQAGENRLSLILNGKSFEVRQQRVGGNLQVFVGNKAFQVVVRDPRSLRNRKQTASAEAGPQKVIASMPGKVVRVIAVEGQKISAGQGIVVMEAMKMQSELRSPKEGTLTKLHATVGMNANAGDVLAIVD